MILVLPYEISGYEISGYGKRMPLVFSCVVETLKAVDTSCNCTKSMSHASKLHQEHYWITSRVTLHIGKGVGLKARKKYGNALIWQRQNLLEF